MELLVYPAILRLAGAKDWQGGLNNETFVFYLQIGRGYLGDVFLAIRRTLATPCQVT